MLWLAVLLVATPAALLPAQHGGRNTDDLSLAQQFTENPARAEELYLGKSMTLLGRVESIRRDPLSGSFAVTIAPRTTPAVPVACRLTRSAAAKLKRGQLLVAEGTLIRGDRNDLMLRGCRVAYDFTVEPDVAGVAIDRCVAHFMRSLCKSPRDCKENAAPFAEKLEHPSARRSTGSTLSCRNPVVTVMVNCHRGEPRMPSCSQRSEIVALMNAMVATESGETPPEAGHELSVEKPDRGPLLDAAIRSGALPDDEP